MSDDANIYAKLAEEFPREQVSWRAQNITAEGDKALALAYIDARDVMDRFDAVVGPDNWSDTYDVHPNVTICSIALRVDGSWVTKADGAGDTDVEAEKGRISDAFKRAAVKWGIGRYLYRMEAVWAECELTDNGKWKKWTAKGLATLAVAANAPPAAKEGDVPDSFLSFIAGLSNDPDPAGYWKANFPGVPSEWRPACVNFKDKLKTKEPA